MRYNKIFIDISNFYMRAYCVCQNSKDIDEKKLIENAIHTAFMMIRALEDKYLTENGKIFFLFDNTHSGENRRKEIDPDYKSSRTKKDDVFFRTLDLLHNMLLSYKDSYICVQCNGYEADDLVAPLVKMYPEDMVLLISNDMDWSRVISEKVHLGKYEGGKYRIYTREEYFLKYGFIPTESAVIMYKSFRGDPSDDIPNAVLNFKEKDLLKVVRDYKNIDELLRLLDGNKYITDKFKERIRSNATRLRLNERLVSFQPIEKDVLEEGMQNCKYKAVTLKTFYDTLGFDIFKFDPRVYRDTIKNQKIDEGNFFQFDTIGRK